jgi:acyl-CoA thioester hydrolase
VTRLPALGVVAETGCRYLSEAAFPTPLEVGMALVRLGRSSVTYRLAVFSVGAEEPHVVGRFVHVYVDPRTRRPTAVPPVVAAAVSALPLTTGDADARR